MPEQSLILFSDLDGTLLDHDTYDWSPARPALQRLANHGIPLVLTSSKTRPEIADLRRQMANHHPFIVENGAAIIIPANYFEAGPEQVICTGTTREDILEHLQALRAQGYQFTGFADLSDQALAEMTGLTPDAAGRAADRVATEPVLWQGTDTALDEFRRALETNGLNLLAGGRFLHVMGAFDKADSMTLLMGKYRSRWPRKPWLSVALGDSPNDQAMLAGADLAILISGHKTDQIELPSHQQKMRSDSPGPVGWNRCVMDVLSRHGYD